MEKVIHKIHDSGHYEPHTNSYCGLGDSYTRGFEHGTTIDDKVTCKKCLRWQTSPTQRINQS